MISELYLGLISGLGASSIWAVSSVVFSFAGRQLRPSVVNALRLVFALVLALSAHLIQTGSLLPETSSWQLWTLSLSGMIGLGLGDMALFYAFDAVGARLAMLIAASAPPLAALLGWLILHESLSLLSLVGMVLTLGGILWVVLERSDKAPTTKRITQGIIFGSLAAIGQAIGVLLSKEGMTATDGPALSAQSAALIRMMSASAIIFPIELGRLRTGAKVLQEGATSWKKGVFLCAVGALLGTFFGMWFSLVATRYAPLGIAQTLLSLPPVFVLPLSYFVLKEKISLRAVLGALLAVFGTSLLFWS